MIDNHFKDYYPISNYNEISRYCRSENMDTEYFLYKIYEGKKRNRTNRRKNNPSV